MKIGNSGFGIKDMIIFMSILLMFLFIAVNNVNKLYEAMNNTKNSVSYINNNYNNSQEETSTKSYTEPVDNNYYKNLEIRFRKATLEYLNDYKYDLNTEILRIDSDTLVNLNYIIMKDQFGDNTCSGYSNAFYDHELEDYTVKSSIRCINYTTEGY